MNDDMNDGFPPVGILALSVMMATCTTRTHTWANKRTMQPMAHAAV